MGTVANKVFILGQNKAADLNPCVRILAVRIDWPTVVQVTKNDDITFARPIETWCLGVPTITYIEATKPPNHYLPSFGVWGIFRASVAWPR